MQPPDARAAIEMRYFDTLPKVLRDAMNDCCLTLDANMVEQARDAGLSDHEIAARLRDKTTRFAALSPEQRGLT